MNKYYISYCIHLLRVTKFYYIIINFNKQLTEKNLEEIKYEIVKECYEKFEITTNIDNVIILGIVKLDE